MADVNDVLTLAEAKLAIANNAGNVNDTLLAASITGVSQFLDELCGPIVIRTITDELHDGGEPTILLRQPPVVDVSAASEFAYTVERVLTKETIGTVPQFGYLVDKPLTGIVYRRSLGLDYWFYPGRNNVKVTYTAGRYTDTASVAERFKRAAGVTLANYWRREHGGGGVALGTVGITYGLPDAVRTWLNQDIRTDEAW